MAAANGLIEAAEATGNPYRALVRALRLRLRLPRRRSRPRTGRLPPGPGDRSRQRQPQPTSHSWRSIWPASRPSTATRWPRSITSLLAIRNYHDAGDTTNYRATRWLSSPPCSTGSDATNRRPPSPVSRSAPSPRVAIPELNTAITHLRDVLGDQTYESLARKGETMTTAAMATYAYDQIDQARAELNAVSK